MTRPTKEGSFTLRNTHCYTIVYNVHTQLMFETSRSETFLSAEVQPVTLVREVVVDMQCIQTIFKSIGSLNLQ